MNELYAQRGRASVNLDRLSADPSQHLRDLGVHGATYAEPVIVLLDKHADSAGAFCDTVGLHGDNDAPLSTIDRAIAALQ